MGLIVLFSCLGLTVLIACLLLAGFIGWKNRSRYDNHPNLNRRPAPSTRIARKQRKPDWVIQEILRLKAHLPADGCRTIATHFNRLFADQGMSVGKTWVATTLTKHHYEIQVLRRKIKNRPAMRVPRNTYWGMDLTHVSDSEKQVHPILGICEHHSRLSIQLKRVSDKTSLTLLRCLLDAIEAFGKPRIIRTDNEAVLTSRLFRFGLWLLGIRHQTTELHCPWQNGRIERLFGTFKGRIRHLAITHAAQLDRHLVEFRWWYNEVRPHQNLGGRTPAEVWLKTRPAHASQWHYVSLWNGVLNGFYPRR